MARALRWRSGTRGRRTSTSRSWGHPRAGPGLRLGPLAVAVGSRPCRLGSLIPAERRAAPTGTAPQTARTAPAARRTAARARTATAPLAGAGAGVDTAAGGYSPRVLHPMRRRPWRSGKGRAHRGQDHRQLHSGVQPTRPRCATPSSASDRQRPWPATYPTICPRSKSGRPRPGQGRRGTRRPLFEPGRGQRRRRWAGVEAARGT